MVALQRWPEEGLPPSPAGWIITTARRRGIDQIRRESTRDDRQAAGHRMLNEPDEPRDLGPVADDQLRLIFTCCHPALAPEVQVALTLRLIAGLQTPEIAQAFLVPEPTMAQRIVRAKKKIKAANIPYRVPEDHELPDRLRPVLAVVYLVFNEGYVASSGDALVRTRAVRSRPSAWPASSPSSCPTSPRCSACSRCCCSPSHAAPPAPTPTARWCACPTRTARSGTPRSSRRARRSCASCCAATRPARTRSRPPSPRCTATPPAPTTPTGTRSWRSTTSSTRSCPTPGRRPQPRHRRRRAPAAPRPAWRSSTTSTSRSTTCSPPPAPTSSSASAAHDEAAAAYEEAMALTENQAERDLLDRRRRELLVDLTTICVDCLRDHVAQMRRRSRVDVGRPAGMDDVGATGAGCGRASSGCWRTTTGGAWWPRSCSVRRRSTR